MHRGLGGQLAEETASIEQISNDGGGHLDVARPSQSLVPLRAILSDGNDVAQRKPDHVLMQAIYHLMRRGEESRSSHKLSRRQQQPASSPECGEGD
jgi:hypothetical protein